MKASKLEQMHVLKHGSALQLRTLLSNVEPVNGKFDRGGGRESQRSEKYKFEALSKGRFLVEYEPGFKRRKLFGRRNPPVRESARTICGPIICPLTFKPTFRHLDDTNL